MASNADDIADEIRAKLAEQQQIAEITRAAQERADTVCDYARSISPQDSGEYKDAWHVERGPDTDDGLPTFRVVNDDDKANLIEYGTVDTPEFAVAARTAAHFAGTDTR